MQYAIWLRSKRTGEPVWHEDSILPGIVPDHVLDLMITGVIRELGMCWQCPLAGHCHIMVHVPGESGMPGLCTVLFHDAVKPEWKLEEVV